jgi:hypothetical protein
MDLTADHPEPPVITKPLPVIAAARDLHPQIEQAFNYHPPIGDQVGRYAQLRQAAKDFAYLIDAICPHSRERALSMTHLENCFMWANASIARNG